ncbi:MAG: hypothetical protein Q9199_002304 [Rusavskia elegans]
MAPFGTNGAVPSRFVFLTVPQGGVSPIVEYLVQQPELLEAQGPWNKPYVAHQKVHHWLDSIEACFQLLDQSMTKASNLPSKGSSNSAIVPETAFLQNVESLVSKAWSWHESMGELDCIVYFGRLSMEQLAGMEPRILKWVDSFRRRTELRREQLWGKALRTAHDGGVDSVKHGVVAKVEA